MTPIEPQEDGIEARRYYHQSDTARDQTVYTERTPDSELLFVDQILSSGLTLQHLNGAQRRNGYTEVTRLSGQVTDVIVWTDSGKTQKIHEVNITRSSGQVSQIVEKLYSASGSLLAGGTFTKTIARSGGRVASITVVQS
jgi:hypothetical protein